MSNTALLLADGLIATTAIAERVLRDAFGPVKVITPESLPGTTLCGRPLFISRLCHPRYSWLPEYLRERSANYVYLLDDNFYELSVDYDAHNGAFFSHPAVHDSLTAFLRGASYVWVMSQPLGDYLQQRLPDLRVAWIPAPVDIDLFDAAATSTNRIASPRSNRPFTVGYPTTRRPNVAELVTQVVHLATEKWRDEIRFEFIGWCPDAITEYPNVVSFPATSDYESFAKVLCASQWDAAIAPLNESIFENCKTNVKFREYGAARIAGIYSRGPLFESSVRHGENGLLADWDPTDWVAQIDRIKSDNDLRASITQLARQDVEHVHAQAVVARMLRTKFSGCFAQ
ncbi:MAG: glycosyltransferase [Casimicrobium sp.]